MSSTRSFAVINTDDHIRENSSSGGAFFVLAERILHDGGIVFGATFDKDWQVNHEACKDISGLYRLLQSKYVQSSAENTFAEVKDNLLKEKIVLYCGTPCQIHGLLSYLSYACYDDSWKKRLITVDFICHGVPSRMVWRRYISEIAGDKTISSINFRDKTYGWINFGLRVNFLDGSTYMQIHRKDAYLRGFLRNLFLRESCHECQFKGIDRPSDFTLADFWGIQSVLPELFDDKGTSIIMAHNKRALFILEELKNKFLVYEIKNESIVKSNSALIKSVSQHKKRSDFFAAVKKNDISTLILKSLHRPIGERIIEKIRSFI